MGTAVKLASGAPEAALRAAGTPHGTQLASAVGAIGVALTTTALIPFALFCLAAGFGALRTRILPRWISIGALAVGAALDVNGCFVSTENVPALLLMALWSIAASVHLVRTAGRTAGRTEVPTEPAIAAPPSDLSGRPSP